MFRKKIFSNTPKGKFISFSAAKEETRKGEIQLALQVPIKSQKAINELRKRMDYVIKKNPPLINFQENPDNFHITLQVFLPSTDQIDMVNALFQFFLKKYSNKIQIRITHKNDIFGYEETCKYPVALVESEQLLQLQADFLNELEDNNIRCIKHPAYRPHVSLLVAGAPVVSDSFKGFSNSSVKFEANLELSHKNDLNQFIILTPDSLDEISGLFKPITKNGFLHHFKLLNDDDLTFDKRWFHAINDRFIENKIGLFCVQNNISAHDAIHALKELKFSDYFDECKGTFDFHKHYRFTQQWDRVKQSKEHELLQMFHDHLPKGKSSRPHVEPNLNKKANNDKFIELTAHRYSSQHNQDNQLSSAEVGYTVASLGMYAYLKNCVGLESKLSTPASIVTIALAIILPPVAMLLGIGSLFCPSKNRHDNEEKNSVQTFRLVK